MVSAPKRLLLSTAVGSFFQGNSKHLAFLASANLNCLHVSHGTVSLKLIGYCLKSYLLALICTIFPFFVGCVLLRSHGKTNTLSECYYLDFHQIPINFHVRESLLPQSLLLSNIPSPAHLHLIWKYCFSDLFTKRHDARQEAYQDIRVHTPFMGFINNNDFVLWKQEVLRREMDFITWSLTQSHLYVKTSYSYTNTNPPILMAVISPTYLSSLMCSPCTKQSSSPLSSLLSFYTR